MHSTKTGAIHHKRSSCKTSYHRQGFRGTGRKTSVGPIDLAMHRGGTSIRCQCLVDVRGNFKIWYSWWPLLRRPTRRRWLNISAVRVYHWTGGTWEQAESVCTVSHDMTDGGIWNTRPGTLTLFLSLINTHLSCLCLDLPGQTDYFWFHCRYFAETFVRKLWENTPIVDELC